MFDNENWAFGPKIKKSGSVITFGPENIFSPIYFSGLVVPQIRSFVWFGRSSGAAEKNYRGLRPRKFFKFFFLERSFLRFGRKRSKTPENVPKTFENVRKRPKTSENVRKRPKTSENVRKRPKTSENARKTFENVRTRGNL